MIINKQAGGVYLIDPTILDPTTRIVSVLSLDCVATSKINTQVPSVILFKDTTGRPTASVTFDTSLQYQDDGGTPTNWTGTIDELLQKLNNEYLVQPTGGGGGGSDASAAKQDQQTALIQQIVNDNQEVVEQYYFTFEDIENQNNKLTFPVTCELVANPSTGIGQSVPSATYADFDALITAFNAGINYYRIEKRTEDSFYLLPNSIDITKESEITNIAFNTGFVSRVFRFFRVNKGAYPSNNITVTRTSNELIRITNGLGLSFTKSYNLAVGASEVFYNWKAIFIDCDAPDGEISIQPIDGTFTGVNFPYLKLNGQVVSGISQNTNSVQKIPYKVTNLGTSVNTITVTITK